MKARYTSWLAGQSDPLEKDTECEIIIKDGKIVVSYEDNYSDRRFANYEGAEIGNGHFELINKRSGLTATLIRDPNDDTILAGKWEGGAEYPQGGTWMIQLDE